MSNFPGYPPLDTNFTAVSYSQNINLLNDFMDQVQIALQNGLDINNFPAQTFDVTVRDTDIVNVNKFTFRKPNILGTRRVRSVEILYFRSNNNWQDHIIYVNWQENANNGIDVWFVSPTITALNNRTWNIRIEIRGA